MILPSRIKSGLPKGGAPACAAGRERGTATMRNGDARITTWYPGRA